MHKYILKILFLDHFKFRQLHDENEVFRIAVVSRIKIKRDELYFINTVVRVYEILC